MIRQVPGMMTARLGPVLLLFILLYPALARAADPCQAAGQEIDRIMQQVMDLVKRCEKTGKDPCADSYNRQTPETENPCMDPRPEPCSKDELAEIGVKVKALTEKAEALRKRCYGGGF